MLNGLEREFVKCRVIITALRVLQMWCRAEKSIVALVSKLRLERLSEAFGKDHEGNEVDRSDAVVYASMSGRRIDVQTWSV